MPDLPPGENPLPKILVLVGPTASGKTAVSLHLAALLNGSVISADSRQIYRMMDIGTAKPTQAERAGVRHYFIDELDPDQDFNAGEFGKQGRAVADGLVGKGILPIVVGGSGLYVRSMVDGFFNGPSADPLIRRELTGRLAVEGAEALLEELRTVDPAAASGMLPSNTRRIIRALEVYRLTGSSLSALQQEKIPMPFRPVFAGLRWERGALYRRIDARVDEMMRAGLVNEVKSILAAGYSPDLNALQTVGYREIIAMLRGVMDEEEAAELIRQNSRRFAKRQMTWFRPDARIRWFDMTSGTDAPATAAAIAGYFRKIS